MIWCQHWILWFLLSLSGLWTSSRPSATRSFQSSSSAAPFGWFTTSKLARLLPTLLLCRVGRLCHFCSCGIKYSLVALCSPLVVRYWNSNWSFLNDPGTSKAFYRVCFSPLQANRFNYLCFLLPKTDSINFKVYFFFFALKDLIITREFSLKP